MSYRHAFFTRAFARFACLVSVVAMLLPGIAAAAPVRWTLSNVTFEDGGTASGSFVYDAVANTVDSWSIAVAGGGTSTFPPLTYANGNSAAIYADGFGNPQPTLLITLNNSQRVLRMTPNAPLTSAGGTVALNLNTAGNRSGGVECFNCGPAREIRSGSLVGVPVAGTFTIIPGISGNWYNAGQDGHGFQFEVLPGNLVTAIWFAFDNAGNQVWISGAGAIDGDRVVMNAGRVLNGRFPPNFNPTTVERRPWGTLTITFASCTAARVEWTSTDAAFTPTGTIDLQRLTTLAGLPCQ